MHIAKVAKEEKLEEVHKAEIKAKFTPFPTPFCEKKKNNVISYTD